MNPSFVIMGLPASGKTTFLAALWHLVESGETDCRLKIDGYRGNYRYLNSIADSWREFGKLSRTSQTGDTEVEINLHDQVTGARGTALFPDLAGEVFDLQVEERRCKSDFVMQADAEDGILFFLLIPMLRKMRFRSLSTIIGCPLSLDTKRGAQTP